MQWAGMTEGEELEGKVQSWLILEKLGPRAFSEAGENFVPRITHDFLDFVGIFSRRGGWAPSWVSDAPAIGAAVLKQIPSVDVTAFRRQLYVTG